MARSGLSLKQFPYVTLLIAIGISQAATQSVVVTGKKQTYRRPQPDIEYKRTFSIRRPVVTAKTRALSRKITAVLRPENVLDIRLREELRDYQWLSEADFKVRFNKNGVLTVEEWMEGSGAYSSVVTKFVVVDIARGHRVRPVDVFADLTGLVRAVKRKQDDEVKAASDEIRKMPDIREPEDLFSNADFNMNDLAEFSVAVSGVTFHYDYGFPHVMLAVEPAGEYFFNWAQLSPFIRRDGLLARFIR